MADDRYDRVTFHGRTVDKFTRAALEAAEKRLGYELTIAQGSYNAGGVTASAGTHDGGGAVDLAPFDKDNKVRVLRELGFAAWYRPAIPGLWGAHIHAIQYGNTRVSAGAARQIEAYKSGRDGLAGNGPDNGPRIELKVFNYQRWINPVSRITDARSHLNSARAVLWVAWRANKGPRRVAIGTALTAIRAALAALPKV